MGDKMKKYLLGIILVLLLSLILVMITFNKKKIVGKWMVIDSEYEYYYIFNKDKTCSYEMVGARLDCTYHEKDDELIISYKGTDRKYTFKYRFEDNYLVIKDSTGKDNKFISKQKKD